MEDLVALLLSSSSEDDISEQGLIGPMLIVLDVGFIISSAVAIVMSLYVLRTRVRVIQKRSKEESSSVKITPEFTSESMSSSDDHVPAVNNVFKNNSAAANDEYSVKSWG